MTYIKLKSVLESNPNFSHHSVYNRIKLNVFNMPHKDIKENIFDSLKDYKISNYQIVSKIYSHVYDSAIFEIDNKRYIITLCDPAKYENDGLIFEKLLLSYLNNETHNEYYDILLNKMNINKSDIIKAEHTGTKRHVRGINIDLNISNIGREVSDIILYLKNGTTRYLSLKNAANPNAVVNLLSGTKVDFINELDNQIILDQDKYKENNSYIKRILETLDISSQEIADGFNKYYQKHGVTSKNRTRTFESIDIMSKKTRECIHNFISCIYGFGYTHVYNNSQSIYVTKIRNPQDARNAAGSINSIKIKYPSENRKHFKIKVESFSNIFNARSQYYLTIRNPYGEFLPLQFESSKIIYF